MVKHTSIIKTVLPFFTLLGFLCGCVDFKMCSAWSKQELIVDGKDSDWAMPLLKEKNIAFGACNDENNLYLCFSVTDRMTKAQLLGLFKQDFYLWLSTKQEKKHALGIRFSNGSSFMATSLLAKARYMEVQSFQVIADEMMKNLTIELVRGTGTATKLAEAKGVSVSFGVSDEGRKITYEFRIPLKESPACPFAINVAAGELIFVGLETSPLDLYEILKQSKSNKEANDTFYESKGLPGQGRRSGRYAMESRNELETAWALERFNPVQVWCKIILAKRP